jgi:hypothetical protein
MIRNARDVRELPLLGAALAEDAHDAELRIRPLCGMFMLLLAILESSSAERRKQLAALRERFAGMTAIF